MEIGLISMLTCVSNLQKKIKEVYSEFNFATKCSHISLCALLLLAREDKCTFDQVFFTKY